MRYFSGSNNKRILLNQINVFFGIQRSAELQKYTRHPVVRQQKVSILNLLSHPLGEQTTAALVSGVNAEPPRNIHKKYEARIQREVEPAT